MDTGLTTISEADIDKHRATAQSMITRIIVLEGDGGGSRGTPRHHKQRSRRAGRARRWWRAPVAES